MSSSWHMSLNKKLDNLAYCTPRCEESAGRVVSWRPVASSVLKAGANDEEGIGVLTNAVMFSFPLTLELIGASVLDFGARLVCTIPCALLDLFGHPKESLKILIETPILLIYDIACSVLGLVGLVVGSVLGLVVAILAALNIVYRGLRWLFEQMVTGCYDLAIALRPRG